MTLDFHVSFDVLVDYYYVNGWFASTVLFALYRPLQNFMFFVGIPRPVVVVQQTLFSFNNFICYSRVSFVMMGD